MIKQLEEEVVKSLENCFLTGLYSKIKEELYRQRISKHADDILKERNEVREKLWNDGQEFKRWLKNGKRK